MAAWGWGHEADLIFLGWVRKAATHELRRRWRTLTDIAYRDDKWKVVAIERELKRRGAPLPHWLE